MPVLILNSSSAASCKFTMAAADQSIARVIFLVSINVVFLLAGLHILHFRSKFHNIADCSPAGEFTISQHAAGSASSSDDCTSDHCCNHNHTGASLNKKDITGQPYLMSHINVEASHSALSSVDQVLQSCNPCILVRNANLISTTAIQSSSSSSTNNVRRFETYGVAVHLFIKMSAYRGGSNTFAIIGLEAKEPARLYEDPPYECEWIPAGARRALVKGLAFKMFPDDGNIYSHLYNAVTINCTFQENVGTDKMGGELVVYASYGDAFWRKAERIVALTEAPGEYQSTSAANNIYEYVYCGSPLFGNLSPQRIREWIAYHARFFGSKAHFFLYDAGGVHADVQRVLEPWITLGRVTVDNIRGQEKFDGYYHNQFMVVNDCFHRARHLARWLFFFDVDEYLWMPSDAGSLESMFAKFENHAQVIIWQNPMSRNMCIATDNVSDDPPVSLPRKWGFEKLVFRNVRKREHNDCKYAIQARKALATGIHRSGHLIGANTTVYADPLKYYHYHNTINRREELCQEFIHPKNKNKVYTNPWNGDPFVYDNGMAILGDEIKKFEQDSVVAPQQFII
ncbi:unnamed protein product [Sphagnum troendelagicum]|uniref:Glycosyltransferase family 92 protein n=1 Tax=Sphagnum troendelagicum TaxID=128251 RepID=A0ABP0T7K6_9BRYO